MIRYFYCFIPCFTSADLVNIGIFIEENFAVPDLSDFDCRAIDWSGFRAVIFPEQTGPLS